MYVNERATIQPYSEPYFIALDTSREGGGRVRGVRVGAVCCVVALRRPALGYPSVDPILH